MPDLLMIRYAVKGVPWTRVALGAGLVVLLIELVRWNPWVLWPLQGTAVGLLAGTAGWCFDETSAVVVDVTPRSLAWRTAARTPAVLALGLVWCGAVAHAGDEALFGRSASVLVEGFAALAAGSAYAGWRRAWGEPTPGLLLAAAAVPATAAWALVRPFDARLPVFPYGTSSAAAWTASTAGWVTLGVLAVAVLAAALTDAPWWRCCCRTCRRAGPASTPATSNTATCRSRPSSTGGRGRA
ncbi:hypothetical protein AB0C12_32895 [Actinoplanes sp. NPDC048967]|uniref:hypothetical protein n=1 Tax=Actinoplanes sp. NPDC048967 TaxID=3155269 RepID=UPI0034065B08